MILLIDIGNTYTKISSDDRKHFYQFLSSSYNDFESLESVFPNTIEESIEGAIISSVVRNKENIFKEYLDKKYNIDSLILTHDLKFHCEYPEKDKNELGGDLIAIMEGASKKHETFIGVSLGTATVFVVVKNLKFIGCAIAPGVFTSLNGLINSASLIENTNLSGDFELLGMDTESSLKSGLWNGFSFLVDGYITKIKEEYDMFGAETYMVGGFSNTIINNLKNENISYDKDLIFSGLYEIYKLNR